MCSPEESEGKRDLDQFSEKKCILYTYRLGNQPRLLYRRLGGIGNVI